MTTETLHLPTSDVHTIQVSSRVIQMSASDVLAEICVIDSMTQSELTWRQEFWRGPAPSKRRHEDSVTAECDFAGLHWEGVVPVLLSTPVLAAIVRTVARSLAESKG